MHTKDRLAMARREACLVEMARLSLPLWLAQLPWSSQCTRLE
jgi:hypothetical protein